MTTENPGKLSKIESIRVGLAFPERIKKWAKRTLPNGKIVGQVVSSQTVNYKTFKPETGGLFCERIFGPLKDFECACGRKKNKKHQRFCPDCDVEFTVARIRRYRLGYIQLVSPVAHVWYLKGRPSYISILLNMKRKHLEAITYCTETTSISGINFADLYSSPWSNVKNPSIAALNLENSQRPFYPTSDRVPLVVGVMASVASQTTEVGVKDYTSFQHDSMEAQHDIHDLSRYMSASFEDEDTPIPLYFNQIKDHFLLLKNIYNNPTHFDIPVPLIGAEALYFLLQTVDLQFLNEQIKSELFELDGEIREFENQPYLLRIEKKRLKELEKVRLQKIRRLKLVRNFIRSKSRPEWMILSILPVLPPDLRPIIKLDGDQVAVSDLNKLYQKVIYRNNRLKRYKKAKETLTIILYTQRLLQEAVDALIENGKGKAEPISAPNGRPLKSLSDMLKGKKGRFRQNLLGKRVDYSGRSVIVVGPRLKIHECGLPKEMAIELFQPFLIRRLLTTQIVRTIVSAKRLIQRQDPIIWEILRQIFKNHPILLNRAPTLHRLGIQAFQPKLVDGRAILLHPLVCPAFNADFDGDQMAVHVPLSCKARAEAWKLMWSRNNLLSPATGQPILIPSQDMVLGCYYLTTTNSKAFKGIGKYFIDLNDSLKAFNQKKIALHAPIWVRWSGQFETGNLIEKPLEIRIDCFGNISNLYHKYQRTLDKNLIQKSQFIRTTAGRILLNQILLKA